MKLHSSPGIVIFLSNHITTMLEKRKYQLSRKQHIGKEWAFEPDKLRLLRRNENYYHMANSDI